MNRPGLLAASVSRRVNSTDVSGSASAFLLMKTRPVAVAAQSVELSHVVRPSAATPSPPVRSAPDSDQLSCSGWIAKRRPVAARHGKHSGEFIAIGPQLGHRLRSYPIRFAPPHVPGSNKHGLADRGIGNDWNVE